jgi:EAL domain-containing protein (putative c-di-GMP-specific phosphodiesterase class I)
VGEWVLKEGCRQARQWRAHAPEGFRIAVNLFAAQVLGDDLERQVLAALNAAEVPAGALELEITENTVLAQNDASNAMWGRLVDAGVSLAFDDYGTGYAALNLLKSLPISRLKIDRTFVSDVVSNREDAAVVQAIVYLGKNFGMRVVAEGVETREQARMLRALQCSEVQGYFYSPPIDADEFAERFLDTVQAKHGHI